MKILLLTTLIFYSSITSKEDTGNIQISVNGLTSKNGNVIIALVDDEKSYMQKTPPYKSVSVPVKDDFTCSYIFQNIPYGKYGIQLFHDENNNRILDTRLGIPKEAYGFSNNVIGKFKKPKFDKVCFELSTSNVYQMITVK